MLRHLRHLDVAAVSRVAILAVALGSAAGSMARGDERILTPDAALSSTNRPDEESPTTANIDNSMAPLRDQELTSQEQIDPGTLSEAALGDSKSPQELTFVGGTLIPEPGIGASLRQREAAALQGGTADEETYCFVMFDGRTTPGRLSTLTAVVSEVLGYHHYHSYKVRLRFSDVERVAQLPFVYWVGYVQPEQKIHPDLVELRRHDPSDRGLVVINLFDSDVTGASLFAEREEGGKRAQVVVDTRHPHQEILRSLGAEIVRYDEVLRAYVASVRLDALSAIAGLDFVLHVEPLLEDESHHDQSTATVYTDYLRDASGPGYDGTGVSIGIMDSGYEVDHVDLPTPGFHVSYCTGPWDEDGLGHGSHVAGTVLGRGIGDGRYTGNAPGIAGSDLQIVRLFDNSGNACGGGALDAMDYFALSPRPRIVHGSLGAGSGGNGTDARSRKADQYIKDYGQIYVFSAGNGGSGSSTVGAPGDAKNVITVGNTLDFTGTDGDADDIWTSSSRGPTGDGRYKPDVCAPGRWIWSVNAATTNGYKQSSGTSMAAPHVSGIVAGYLEHYPSRAAYPALVKAALGSASLAHGGSIGRDNSYGMGRIDAMMLHYSADNADGWNTLLVNNTSGLGATGNWGYSDFTLPSGVDRLVITLNWIENAASSGDSYAVINDLDLYLDLGNNQSGGNTGDYSSITSHDNVEYIVVSNPPAGTHRVKVYAYDINDGPQPFSFVVNYYRGDPTPTSDVSQQIDDVMVQPFEEFHCTASVTPRELIAKGFWTELDVPGAVQVLAMERTLEDGEVVVYDSGDSDPSRYGINLGDVQYDVSRTVTWTMRGSSEGVHRVGIDYDSDNSGTATTAVNVTVDGTVPNSTITSCPPPYSTNNDPTLCWTGTDNYTPVAELVYSYRLNGGSWSAWTGNTCAGFSNLPDGTHLFEVRARDLAGNVESSYASCQFGIDTTPPNPPSGLLSSSHSVGGYSNDATIDVQWSAGTDAASGVAGYSYLWSNDSATTPDVTVDTGGLGTSSSALPEGDWWFHVRTVDNVGFGSSTVHLGPFHIDLTVPTNPSITSTSHVTDDCSNDCTVDVQWSGASGSPFVLAQLGLIPSSDTGPTGANLDASGDPTSMGRAGISALEGEELGPLAVGGSGIAGYSIEWSHAPDTVPDQIIDTGGESTTSPCLADGDWWFHLRTADVAGNWSDAVHFGVLSIDTTAPTNPTTVESASHQVSVWSPDPTIEANWSGSTDNGGCGVAGYSVEWSTSPGTVPDSVIETTVESATSPPLSDSNSWWLHVRAIDAVGIPAPGAVHLGPFWIDGTAPEATMSFPNGGEHFLGLDEIQISFVATDQTSGVGNVRFDLSTDGGSTWPESIYDGTNPGSPFPWTVTDVTTDTARLRVTVTDAAGNETEDVSDGDFSILATSGADEIQPLPDHVSLLPAAPNPAGMMGTRIGFALPGEAHVRLDIFGVGGRRVANLLDARQPAGLHWVSWRGTDDSGRRLSPGIYLVRLRTLGAEEVEEVVLLR